MTQDNPCRVWRDETANEDSSIQCDLCDQWNHIDCIGISIRKYEKLKSDSSPWYCPICLSEFPFFQMNDKELKSFLKISKTSATPTQVLNKTNLRTKELMKVLSSSNKCLKSLKTQLAATTTMFMISTRSRFISMTYQLSILTYHLWPLTYMN